MQDTPESNATTRLSHAEVISPQSSIAGSTPEAPLARPRVYLTASENSALSRREYYSPEYMHSLKLLHHYSTTVYTTLVREPATIEMWKLRVPQIACAHEFFMHGLLAVSALHYAHSHPEHRQEFAVISSAYQNLALQHFSSNLQDINEENRDTFFLLASFIFIASVCSIASPYGPEKSVTSRDVAQSFYLLQGVRHILDFKPIERWREESILAPLLQPFGSSVARKSLNFQQRMEKVADLARKLPVGLSVINERSASLMAIEALRSAHYETADEHSALSARRIWIWPFTLPPLFFEMLENDHPIALIILTHFAALAKPFEHQVWITRGWSANVLSLAGRVLDDP
ncbi:hypothetical protein BGZ61DRAFT_475438 [Ilyonectria robusta]|uniref:uncharacterized protein n=1 Tax=Ilyonectria robusta TaxID=1079257 RepID=UPI001E8DA85E|nr:uncharacterized protein BGZ61DRAFT_475438 [Ilyonectria robusta]KAH8729878.1 hypothetical protein BGZ61DRAFT_475438 [Ilyonectria robusta]